MTLRWGIVSAGLISHDFVTAFNSYSDVGDQVIAAVVARDKKRATDFAHLHNINKVFDSYESLARSSDIDVAYIGAVNTEHYRIAKLFLENGKHVLCEKPLCMNFKQAQSLINIAKKEKLFLMEAVWSRFSPAYKSLKKEVQSGQLGDPKFVEVDFGVQIVSVERLWKKSLGGGAVLDIGIYALQFAQYIFKDEPLKVTAIGKLNNEGVDIAETIILEYSEDRKAVLNIDTTLTLWNKATVVGTKGRATLEDSFHFPDSLIHTDGSIEKFPLHNTKFKTNFHNSAGLVFQALEVCRCIKTGLLESPRMSHDDSLVLAKLEDMVRKQLGVHYDVDDMDF